MYPKTAWKFKAWHEAMLRNATVDTPDYGKKTAGKSTGSKVSQTRRRRRKRRKRNATKD